jgi:hypothetical protein
MKPHKHAEMIKAWADGAEIEVNNGHGWFEARLDDFSHESWHFRIKLEPKPDFFTYLTVDHIHTGTQTLYRYSTDNVKFTYDGKTGKLKSAEIL